MLDVVKAELALIERLTQKVGEIPTVPYPDTDNGELPEFTHAVGTIFVRYHGATLPPPTPNMEGAVVQLAAEQFETMLRYRNASGKQNGAHAGALEFLRLIHGALKGFTLPDIADASVLYPIRRQFIGEEGHIWTYTKIWQFTVPDVAAMST